METTTQYRYVDGIEDGIDFDAAYKILGYSGVAWRLLGWAQNAEPVMTYITVDEDGEYDPDGKEVEIESGEWESVDDRTRVVAVMIGDDRRFAFDTCDIQQIPENGFCHGCGQIGCTCEVWE